MGNACARQSDGFHDGLPMPTQHYMSPGPPMNPYYQAYPGSLYANEQQCCQSDTDIEDVAGDLCGCARTKVQAVAASPFIQHTEAVREDSRVVSSYPSTANKRFCYCCGWTLLFLVLIGAIAVGVAVHLGALTLPFLSRGAQPTRFRITNGCQAEAMWVAHLGDVDVGEQSIKIGPGEAYDIDVPTAGLGRSTVRWYSKWRCEEGGSECAIGDSGGNGQKCSSVGCAPPIDSKFSARFGNQAHPCNTTAGLYDGCDFVDVSLQDGFTVPFELIIKGDCGSQHSTPDTKSSTVVDCSSLSVDSCPAAEDLGPFGHKNLLAKNPLWGSAAGCYSPCSKLSYPDWSLTDATSSRMMAKSSQDIANYCCPSLDSCDGRLAKTDFVKNIHSMCPGLNAYDYDRGMGVGTCPSGTQYEMVFKCPTGASFARRGQ
mmetsp:Transcript_35215/g.74988  ORF Transcript_35215/g.74988 Transcript_35215/m.74988 type:complete len:428 (-) Transcript_35215:41-1324(-)|eukprot:CAMPEP_0206475054 /NCGR_PEP_ID=MMETSP0324_2-20121206/33850_1 /ASSEMBLY_ACC=CAM_ASM_000836 /TAXON_ID=2866 /ORGANISM="Crypthecodinium cohnii, Strain Seligo" /LENGTH=427 /DNA_ID=CAMNT_0053950337 /DNA_START=248 /DNA_END=1531 /DNA_ORIENTATION=-